jgi:translation initiation factor IF-1
MKKKNRHQMMDDREDRMELIGKVVESLPGTLFEVKTSTGQTVLATLSGKMRQNHIMVLPGDDVIIEVSPYDTTRGRIMRRK